MLHVIITTLIFCSLQPGIHSGVNDISVCVDSDNDFLLVELQPPFPTNANLLDVDCSSMNDSFRKSCTVQLSAKLNNTISVTVSVHGSGVQMGYVYVVQATIHTSDGSDLESDLVTIEASYVKDVYWQFNNSTSITFHCLLSNFCNAVTAGCQISLIRHIDGKSINKATSIVGSSSVVEVTFDKLNISDTYTFTAYAVSQDLMTPMGQSVSGVILRPVVTTTSSSFSIISPTPSTAVLAISDNPVTSMSTSTTTFGSRIPLPTQSMMIGTDTDNGDTSTGGGSIHSSSKGFHGGVIIGIVVVVILVVLGAFSVIMISANRLWPDGLCDHRADEGPLVLERFYPRTESLLRRSFHIRGNKGSTQHNKASANNQTDNTIGSTMPVANDDIDINEIEIAVNEGFTENDIV